MVRMKGWFCPEDQVWTLGRSNEWRRKDLVEKGQDCEAEGRGRQAGKPGKGAGYGYCLSFLCSTALLFGPLWPQLLSWESANRRALLRQSALNERSGE